MSSTVGTKPPANRPVGRWHAATTRRGTPRSAASPAANFNACSAPADPSMPTTIMNNMVACRCNRRIGVIAGTECGELLSTRSRGGGPMPRRRVEPRWGAPLRLRTRRPSFSLRGGRHPCVPKWHQHRVFGLLDGRVRVVDPQQRARLGLDAILPPSSDYCRSASVGGSAEPASSPSPPEARWTAHPSRFPARCLPEDVLTRRAWCRASSAYPSTCRRIPSDQSLRLKPSRWARGVHVRHCFRGSPAVRDAVVGTDGDAGRCRCRGPPGPSNEASVVLLRRPCGIPVPDSAIAPMPTAA